MSQDKDVQELDSCRHCLVGTVVLETKEVLVPIKDKLMPSLYDLSKRGNLNDEAWRKPPFMISFEKICYCSSCGTLFHAPTYLAKFAEKKSPQ
jgi:hypothetical protein